MNRMKKHILLGGMLLCAAAFTSCNEDFKDWASPQSHAPEDAASAYSISVVAGGDAELVMDNAKDMVEILQVASVPEEMKAFNLKSVTVNGVSLPYEVEGGYVYMKAAQLDSLAEAQTLDRSNTPHQLTVVSEWSGILTSGEAVPTSVETPITVTPSAKVPAIDKNGYAMLGDWQNWNNSNPTWMEEVEPGVYQAVVTTTKDGDSWFKFYNGTPFKENAAPDWGVLDANAFGSPINGDNTTPNLLVWVDDPRYEKLETPVITGAGDWLVTLDMNKFCYKFEPKETRYYIVGNPQGWSTDNKTCLFYALGGNKFTYTTKWTNQWDLKIWSQEHFGDWNAAYGGENGSTAAKGSLIFGGDADGCGAIGPNEAGGWYTFTFDMGSKTYEWQAIAEPTTEYKAISVIGGFNSWSDEGEIELEQLEKAPHNWYARATLDADTELKFRANHSWDVNWGSDKSAAISEDKYYVASGGDNIIVPAGTYDFYLNDITGNWCIAMVVE